MKPLRNAVEDYIALRRSLGFKLRDMATGLREFTAFLEQKEAPYITTTLALEWAMQPVDHQLSDWARRLGFVRVFARHWSATDPRTEIPAAGLLPFRARRARPYLYTEEEIKRLLAAAKSLSPAGGLRPWTYHCLFGLLAVSGLRISEAIKLACVDQPTTPDRGFTTFATDSPLTPSLSGIGLAKILNGAYPCCLPFWVMLMWLIPIGISPFIRS
jgi:integrase